MNIQTITDLLPHVGEGLASAATLVVALLMPVVRARRIRALSPGSVLNAAGKAAVKPAWDGPKKKAPEPEKKEEPTGKKKLSWKWKRKPKDTSPRDLKRFFRHEMSRFRSAVGGGRHIYDYPWFLMLGEAGAGKSTLLKNSRQYPWSAPLAETYPGEALCAWWCSDDAIVLDIAGELLLKGDGTSNAKGWSALMAMLQRHRYQRPIDGIILAISAADLVGDGKLSTEELARKGELLRGKLRDIERRLGMRVPVYPVVTKCDMVEGFASFCAGLPERRRDEMFGWSNPSTLEAGYTPSWIEDAFHSMSSVLYPAQLEMLSELPIGADGDHLFRFPSEFPALAEGLAPQLDRIFSVGGGEPTTLMMRGLYFVGDGDLPGAATEEGAVEELPADARPSDAGPSNGDASGDGEGPSEGEAPVRRLCFVRGLIERKVVPEHAMAVPVGERGLSRNWVKRLLQGGVALVVLLGLLAGFLEYPRLGRSENVIATVLDTINVDMARSRDGRGIDRSQYVRYAEHVLDGHYMIDSSRMFSLLFPSSWVSPLHRDIHRAMMVAYDSIIVKAMRAQLEEKTKNLARYRNVRESLASEAGLVYAIENTQEFKDLRAFTGELMSIEQHATMFNDLHRTGRMKDVLELVRFLFGRELPPDFQDKGEYYHRTLEYSDTEHFDPDPFRADLMNTANILLEHLRQRVFMRNVVLTNIRQVNADLAFLVASNGNSFESIARSATLRDRIAALKSALLDPSTDWIDRPHFEPDSALKTLMADVDRSLYLHDTLGDGKMGERFLGSCELTFQQLREDILNERSDAVGGTIVQVEPGSGVFLLSPTVDTLKDALGGLLAQRFMRARQRGSITQKRGRGTRLAWNGDQLASAAKLQDGFVLFTDDGIARFPERLQTPAMNMARIGLEGTMIELVEPAQRAEPSAGTFEDIQREVENLQGVAPSLLAILRLFDQHQLRAYNELRGVLQGQGEGMLDDLTRLRSNSGLYSVMEEKFLAWEKNPDEPAGSALLDAPDDAAIQDRLDKWREQVRKLVAVGADPILDFLGKVGGGYTDRDAGWRKVVSELHRYDDKAVRNSVSSLEDLYLDLNNITEENYREKLVRRATSDYFLERRESLRARLYAIFSSAVLNRVRRRYEELRQTFNNDLRDALPFADFRDRSVRRSITLDEARGYFQLLDQFVSRDQDVWKQWGDRDYDPDYRPAYRFIDSMIKVRNFLAPLLRNDPDRPAALTLDVEFRANVPKEIDARNIIDWKLKVGDDLLSIQDAVRQGRPLRTLWKVGDRIQLTLRWAKNSPVVPNAALLGNGVVQSDGHTVVYSFNDREWALFHLLSVHRAPLEHLAKNAQPQMLEFTVQSMRQVWSKDDVPLNSTPSDDDTRAFLRIGVLSESQKESMPAPVFPSAPAPPLPPPYQRR